jgi:hypothetical protein
MYDTFADVITRRWNRRDGLLRFDFGCWLRRIGRRLQFCTQLGEFWAICADVVIQRASDGRGVKIFIRDRHIVPEASLASANLSQILSSRLGGAAAEPA